jgi:hypothetical protein
VLYRPDWPGAAHVNSFVVAGAQALSAPARVTFDYVPERNSGSLWQMLAHPRVLDGALLAGGRIVTDARNAALHDLATTQMIHRRSVVETLPAPLLVN